MATHHAYIDESGNTDLAVEKQGVSKYFIVCAVVIPSGQLNILEPQVEEIRRKYFQTGEIKSSKVRDKDGHARRIKILESFLKLDFTFYAIAVEKGSLKKDGGFPFKKSFLKFINGLLYGQLLDNYPSLEIYADEHGGQDFKESFKAYIEKNHKPDLFWKSNLSLVSSHQSVIVQMADFIAGTIAKVYEGKKNPALFEAYKTLLSSKALDLKEWPTKFQIYFEPDQTSKEYDAFIHKHALAKAELFLEKYGENSDEETKLRICALRFLVFKSRLSPDTDYLSTKEILNQLEACGFKGVSDHAIRSTIVSKLRDKDVIIASSHKGYKIPRNYADLHDFVDRVNSQVLPLLERLKRAHNSYIQASSGDVDLLKGPNYPELVKLLELLDKTS